MIVENELKIDRIDLKKWDGDSKKWKNADKEKIEIVEQIRFDIFFNQLFLLFIQMIY